MNQVAQILKNHISSSNLRPSTSGTYERFLENYIVPHLGDTPCSELSNDTMRQFTEKLLGAEIAEHTVKAVLSFLKKGLRGHYPPGVFDVGVSRKPAKEISVLTLREQEKLENFAQYSDGTNRASVFLCLYSGIRLGELCSLMKQDMDFERREFHVRRTVQRLRNTDTGKTAKTALTFMELDGCSNRCIPLPGFLADLLEEHVSLHLGKYVISKDGGPIEPRTLQNRLKNLLYEAGIKSASFQTLRNTFAVRALENNFDVVLLSKIMGHASPSVTYGRYAKFVDRESQLRKNMENLAAAMRR